MDIQDLTVKDVGYKPITLRITLTEESEAHDFYNIFNHSSILHAANNRLSLLTIRDMVSAHLGRGTVYKGTRFTLFADKLRNFLR